MPVDPTTIAVVGAGAMGLGIATAPPQPCCHLGPAALGRSEGAQPLPHGAAALRPFTTQRGDPCRVRNMEVRG